MLHGLEADPTRKNIMTRPYTTGLAAYLTIIEQSTKPRGFAMAVLGLHSKCCEYLAAKKTAERLAQRGELYKAKAPAGKVHYFAGAKKAAAFELANPRIPAPRRSRAKPKPVRVAKVKKALAPVVMARKPWTAPKPRIAAEVVHTAKTRYTIIPTPTPKNTTYSYSFSHGQTKEMTA